MWIYKNNVIYFEAIFLLKFCLGFKDDQIFVKKKPHLHNRERKKIIFWVLR